MAPKYKTKNSITRILRNSDKWRLASKIQRLKHPQCTRCGSKKDLTADHVTPLKKGGNVYGKLQTLCRSCNSSKGAGISKKK